MFRSTRLIAGFALVFLTVGRVQAQPDPNLKPTYGSVKLASGFLPDPFTKDVQAGGNIRTSMGGVNTHVAKAPDFSLHYTRGKYPLSFTVKSAGDTTLLVNLPDGTWMADDDGGGGLDPLIRIANPQSGRYDIYVGTFRKDLVAATLHITELDAARKPSLPINPNLPECYILSAGVDNYPNANKLKGCLNDARNTVAAFKAQTGTMFRSVKERTLLDGAATRGAIHAAFHGFTKQGAANDYMVLFLSGHGARTNGNKGNTWFFLPFDYHPKDFANKSLTDKQLLDISDELVRQKKNVVIIVDACYCGQLGVTAQPYVSRYRNTNAGGMILMLSSGADQTSTALGNYSAYAKALQDTMAGAGDLNKDAKVTLGEIQVYSKRRTAELLAAARSSNKQDSIVAWSPSISKEAPLAHAGKGALAAAKPLPSDAPLRWAGTETLPGYGNLSFAMYSNGRAVMVDAKSTTEGIWRKQDSQYTLSFASGAIVYTGTLNGANLSGTATSPSARQENMRSWTWTVKRQPG
jgi:hypothetical protein